jgi:WD40 repeat protein
MSWSLRSLFTALTVGVVLGGVPTAAEAAPIDLLVSSYNTNSVKRYDGATGAYLGDFASAAANPRGMSLGPDGNLYVGGGAYGDLNGNIRRFDGTTGAFLGTVTSGHPGPIGDVIFGPDGDLYASVLVQDYVIHLDPSTGGLLGIIGAGSPLNDASGLAFGADGNLYVASYPDNQVLRFDGTTGAYLGLFATVPIAGNAGHIADVIFGPDGNLLATIGYAEPTGDIWRFDGTTGASLGAFIPAADPHPAIPVFQVFGPDGNLYVGSSGTDEVLRYNGTTGEFIDSFASGGGLDAPIGLAFVPEPGTGALLGMGLLALARRRRGSGISRG